MGRTRNSDFFTLFLILLLAVPAVAGGDAVPSFPGAAVSTVPAPYTIRLFIPTRNLIHSDQITGLVSAPGGETVIGTSFGLSTYNGSWYTRHTNLDNISEGLMDDYITALAFDSQDNLWIGYSGGLQIFNGKTYRSIRDQELLKDPRINALQQWHDDMWIATGHAGIHRYRNDSWTWYQPMTKGGPAFYEIRSMQVDETHEILVVATDGEGLWIIRTPDTPEFSEISSRYGPYGSLDMVRKDPAGGVYMGNASMIVHYDPVRGFTPVLESSSLGPGKPAINDMAASPDGRIFVATDNGMYIWENGAVTMHLGRYEGMGDSPVIRTVAIDARNRVWFSSTGYVGYYSDQAATVIPIEMVTDTQTITTMPITLVPTARPSVSLAAITGTQEDRSFFSQNSVLGFLNPIVDPIVKALGSIGLHA